MLLLEAEEIQQMETKTQMLEEASVKFSTEQNKSFYNPAQSINRDLSVLAVLAFCSIYAKKAVKILDCTAASGIRPIRYAKSLLSNGYQPKLVACELSQSVHSVLAKNILQNNLQDHIEPRNVNSIEMLLADKNEIYDIIDVDPYGTVEPFISAVLQRASKTSTLLCLTSTDLRVLCKSQQKECFRRYNSIVPVNHFPKEAALRILLQYINSLCIRLKLFMQPMFSLALEHYIRIIVTVSESPKQSLNSVENVGNLLYCSQCKNFETDSFFKDSELKSQLKLPSSCSICGSAFRIGTPLWLGPLHDQCFLQTSLDNLDNCILENKDRSESILKTLKYELPGVVLSYSIGEICSFFHSSSIKLNKILAGIINSGHRASFCLSDPDCIKTDTKYEKFV
ncbi:MAG: tRNA methyltransferase 1, partial [Paramarteilia canceri]